MVELPQSPHLGPVKVGVALEQLAKLVGTHLGDQRARVLIVAIPEGYEAGGIAERGRALNPRLTVIVRAHSDEEVAHLQKLGAQHVVMGEREIAGRMLDLIAPRPREPEAA